MTGLQQSIKGTQKQYFSSRGPVNMAEKKNEEIDMYDFPVHDCTQEQNVCTLCFQRSTIGNLRWRRFRGDGNLLNTGNFFFFSSYSLIQMLLNLSGTDFNFFVIRVDLWAVLQEPLSTT